MGRFRWTTGLLLCAGIFGPVVLSAVPLWAASIIAWDARGGGLIMESGGTASNAPVVVFPIGGGGVESTSAFSKVELAGEDAGDPGSGCAGGAGGSGCSGNCGNSAHSGSDTEVKESGGNDGKHTTGEPAHVEVFERLAPIHLFLTLMNTPGEALPDFYRFTATVENNTDRAWDGFLFALKRNEAGLAKFDYKTESPTATYAEPEDFGEVFSEAFQGGKKLEWSGGVLKPGQAATFTFGINFLDCSDAVDSLFPCSDAVKNLTVENQPADGYQVMLQQFPLVTPVPEPASVLLLGSGLLALCGGLRRRSR